MSALRVNGHLNLVCQRPYIRNLSYPEKVMGETKSDYFDTLFGNELSLTNGGSKLIHRNSASDIITRHMKNNKEAIAVIGSGNFGRAIATKISQSGYEVLIGSRDPEKYK